MKQLFQKTITRSFVPCQGPVPDPSIAKGHLVPTIKVNTFYYSFAKCATNGLVIV
jgi:hypothetical protein